MLGLVGGAVLDIYSSGLALLTAGLRIPRYVAAGVDGVIMVAGAIYVVFFTDDFLGPFQGFLITLGVPVAAWCGIMLADVALRRARLRRARAVRLRPAATATSAGCRSRSSPAGTALGWGLVTNGVASWLDLAGLPARPARPRRQGRPVGYAGLGVLVALLVGLLGTLVGTSRRVRAQES